MKKKTLKEISPWEYRDNPYFKGTDIFCSNSSLKSSLRFYTDNSGRNYIVNPFILLSQFDDSLRGIHFKDPMYGTDFERIELASLGDSFYSEHMSYWENKKKMGSKTYRVIIYDDSERVDKGLDKL